MQIDLTVADWTSPRTLGELPDGLGSSVDFDLILFSADGSGESDARNTTGLMTVEALCSVRADRPRPRVVAEVDDVELAARLNDRYRSMGHPEVHIFSTDELRELVVFQSVVVSHFSEILEELVMPWASDEGTGAGLSPLRVQAQGVAGSAQDFAALAASLRAQGHVLVAAQHAETGAIVFGADDAKVDLEYARLWVIPARTERMQAT